MTIDAQTSIRPHSQHQAVAATVTQRLSARQLYLSADSLQIGSDIRTSQSRKSNPNRRPASLILTRFLRLDVDQPQPDACLCWWALIERLVKALIKASFCRE